MTRNELQNELRKLGFNRLCDDHKTLVAYNAIQFYLSNNRTPIKAVDKVYLDNGTLRAIIYGYDDEIGYTIFEEAESQNGKVQLSTTYGILRKDH